MSRYHLVPLDPAHEIVVGWDRPLHTFFAQVTNVAADEDGDGRTVPAWRLTSNATSCGVSASLGAEGTYAFMLRP